MPNISFSNIGIWDRNVVMIYHCSCMFLGNRTILRQVTTLIMLAYGLGFRLGFGLGYPAFCPVFIL